MLVDMHKIHQNFAKLSLYLLIIYLFIYLFHKILIIFFKV